MNIRIKRNKNGKYFWTLVSRNGRTLATSESYSSKQACQSTVATVSKHSGEIPIKYCD
jgi:uncharacterized protein YegP (UPF0339 family)